MNRLILTLTEQQSQRYRIIYANYSPQSLFLKLIYIANMFKPRLTSKKRREKYKPKVGLRFHRREEDVFCVLALWYTSGIAPKIYKGGPSSLVFHPTFSLSIDIHAIKFTVHLSRTETSFLKRLRARIHHAGVTFYCQGNGTVSLSLMGFLFIRASSCEDHSSCV